MAAVAARRRPDRRAPLPAFGRAGPRPGPRRANAVPPAFHCVAVCLPSASIRGLDLTRPIAPDGAGRANGAIRGPRAARFVSREDAGRLSFYVSDFTRKTYHHFQFTRYAPRYYFRNDVYGFHYE